MLLELVEHERDNIDAWKWLATLATSQQEAFWAIENVLRLDPLDEWATSMLVALDVPVESLVPDAADLDASDASAASRSSIVGWGITAGFVAAGVVVVAAIIFGLTRSIRAASPPTADVAATMTAAGVTPTAVPVTAEVTRLPATWTALPTLTALPSSTPSATVAAAATAPPAAATATTAPPTANPTAIPTVPTATPTETEVPASAWPAERVVIISVDGLRPDAVTEATTPYILSVAERGSFSWTAQTVQPSLTLPAHASMLSGVSVATHGISWNDYIPDNGTIDVPTVFSASSDLDGHTIMVIGQERLLHIAAPGTVDVVRNLHHQSDHAIVSAAIQEMLVIPGFDVLFIHLPQVDLIGHNSGWMSASYMSAVTNADAAIGNFLGALGSAGWTDTTTIIITSDHGGEGLVHTANIPQNTTIPWVMAGPGVRSDHEIFGMTVMDTAPTALYAIDVPVPGGMQGRVLYEAFE